MTTRGWSEEKTTPHTRKENKISEDVVLSNERGP